jgi:hypothetical protein
MKAENIMTRPQYPKEPGPVYRKLASTWHYGTVALNSQLHRGLDAASNVITGNGLNQTEVLKLTIN